MFKFSAILKNILSEWKGKKTQLTVCACCIISSFDFRMLEFALSGFDTIYLTKQ